MRKRKVLFIVTGLCIALLAGAILAYAAPSNTRGRVAVDIGTFTYVDHAGGRSRGLSDEGKGTKYKLYYENYLISNHDNDGVTYRSKNTYDMTDVVKLEFSAYTQTDDSDKFMIYTTSSDYKTFHGKDREDVKDSMYNGQSPATNGKVYSFSSLSTQISNHLYSSNFHYNSFNTDNTYENRYVYIGMSKGFDWAKQGIMLENNTYAVNGSGTQIAGGINLKLKEHKVQLIAPDKPKRIDINNNEVTNSTAYSDLEIKLNDGNGYAPGKQGSVFRGEEIVMSYKWGAGVNGKVVGYNFYADADKKTKLYQMNTTSGTIKFNSNLIQDIETASGKDLGDFYLEPIFQYDQATIKVSDSVAENDAIKIEKTSGSNSYVVYDTSLGNAKVGTIELNQAKYVGDYLRIEYKKEASYTGDYQIESFLLAFCETEDQVNTTTNTGVFYVSGVDPDYNEAIETKYIHILPRTKLRAVIELEDKTVTFSNAKVGIDPAKVTYPLGEKEPPGMDKITYTYYTDAACTMVMDDLPMEAGEYYVIASMPGDSNYYAEAVSQPAKLTIKKAVPTLENLRGVQAIVYSQDLTKTGGVVGNAKGVNGNPVTGTFAWTDATQVLDAGYRKAEVTFTPTGPFEKNYETAKGYGLVVVNADSVIVDVDDAVWTYNGETPSPNAVKVTGKTSGKETDQTVTLSYYTDGSYENQLPEPPVYAGQYYVKATVQNKGNYNGGSGKGLLTIEKAKAQLFLFPVRGDENGLNYRVYMQGPQAEPTGNILITVSHDGGSHALESTGLIKEETERYFAEFSMEDIRGEAPVGSGLSVKAEYSNINLDKQDYQTNEVTQNIYEDALAMTTSRSFVYGDSPQVFDWKEDFSIQEADLEADSITLKWKEIDANDTADITLPSDDDVEGILSVDPKNAGTACIVGLFISEDAYGNRVTRFLRYDITVAQAPVKVTIAGKTEVYDGSPVVIDTAAVTSGTLIPEGTLPWPMRISCTYYEDAGLQHALETAPVDPGEYYAVAKTTETRNYEEGTSDPAKITIEKAPADMTLKGDVVIYDGTPHRLDADLEGTVCKNMLTSEEALDEDINTDDVETVPVRGTITYTYLDKDGQTVDAPVDAGLYEVTASLTKDPIYQDVQETAYLMIVPTYAKIAIGNVEKTYDGLPAQPEITFTANGESLSVPEEVYFEYALKILGGRNTKTGLPVDAGNYYSRASIDRGNYWSTYSSLGEIIIHRASVDVAIPDGYEAEYNGEPVTLHNGVVTFNGKDVTKDFKISYAYYSDAACTEIIEAPQYPGTYYVKAFTTGQRNFKPGESEANTIVIKKRPVFLSNLKINFPSDVTGKAVNAEGIEVPGSFHIADTETFWQLPEGEHDVLVEFVPDTEGARIYYGETGYAKYTVVPEEDPDEGETPDGDKDPSGGDDPDGDKDPSGGNTADDDKDDPSSDHKAPGDDSNGAKSGDEAADTGDHSPIAVYLIFLIGAGTTAAGIMRKRNFDR